MPSPCTVRHECMNSYLEERFCLGPIFLVRESGIHALQNNVNVGNEKNLKYDTHLDDVLHRKRRLETCVYLSTVRQRKNQRGTTEKRQREENEFPPSCSLSRRIHAKH